MIHDVLFYYNLYCHFAYNLQETKCLIKNLPNLKSIKFSILYLHSKCLATKVSSAPYNYIIYLIIYFTLVVYIATCTVYI